MTAEELEKCLQHLETETAIQPTPAYVRRLGKPELKTARMYRWRNGTYTFVVHTMHPVVEFRNGDRVIRFEITRGMRAADVAAIAKDWLS